MPASETDAPGSSAPTRASTSASASVPASASPGAADKEEDVDIFNESQVRFLRNFNITLMFSYLLTYLLTLLFNIR